MIATAALDTLLERLRRRFEAEAPALIAELQLYHSQLASGEVPNGLARLAHRLAGVAGTLGFDEVGEAAATLDSQLLLAGPADRHAVQRLTETLLTCLQATGSRG